jgi:hypothetical protein
MVVMVMIGFALPIVLAYLASTNHRGLRIAGFRFSADGATTFLWICAALSLLVAFLAVWFAIRNSGGPRFLELGPQTALLPEASLSNKLIKVPYVSISQVRLIDVHGHQYVMVDSTVGNASVGAKGFAKPGLFATFVELLQERVKKR